MPRLSGLFGKPLLAGASCAATAYFVFGLASSFISDKIAVVGAIGVAGIVYLLVLFLVKGISGDDIRMLPKGEKIYGIFKKLKLVK